MGERPELLTDLDQRRYDVAVARLRRAVDNEGCHKRNLLHAALVGLAEMGLRVSAASNEVDVATWVRDTQEAAETGIRDLLAELSLRVKYHHWTEAQRLLQRLGLWMHYFMAAATENVLAEEEDADA